MRNSALAIFAYSKTWRTACRNISSVTSAPLPVHRYSPNVGVRCELFGCQPKFNPSTLRKQTFQLADNVAEVRAHLVLRVSLDVLTETVGRHLHVQRSRYVCAIGGLCAGLDQLALNSVGTTPGTPGQLSKTAPSNGTTSTRPLYITYQHTKLLTLTVADADLCVSTRSRFRRHRRKPEQEFSTLTQQLIRPMTVFTFFWILAYGLNILAFLRRPT
jgi:hypothetical protein